MKTALITGSSGFIGTNLTKRLIKDGWKVFANGRHGEQKINGLFLDPHDFDKLCWWNLPKIDVLFHQAAITDTTCYDEKLMYQINVWDSLKLFEDALKHGCRHIVYASSCATYGDVKPPFKEDGTTNPLNVYGKSKLLLDQEALSWGKANNVNIVGLRYSNVFGPYESHKGKNACMVTQIGCQMLLGNPKLFKSGEQRRDFVYVKDIVEYNLAAATYDGQSVFNAGSGKDTSFNEVVEIFNNYLGINRQPSYIDNPYQNKYQNMTMCDMDKTSKHLNVKPKWTIDKAIPDYFKPIVV